MLLNVKVIPNSSVNKVIEEGDGILRIKLMAPAVDGKANQALIKILADHLKIKKNKIKIISGEKNREKSVEIVN